MSARLPLALALVLLAACDRTASPTPTPPSSDGGMQTQAEEAMEAFTVGRGLGETEDDAYAEARLDLAHALFDDPGCTVGIVALPDGRPVGVVAYLEHDREQGRAELRKLIGEPDLRGQGLGTEAARLWVAYGRQGLGLRKVFLYTLAANRRNVHLNERLGFRVEGVLRDEVVIDGRPADLLRMGLIVPELP